MLRCVAPLPHPAGHPQGPEAAEHLGVRGRHDAQARRLRVGAHFRDPAPALHDGGGDPLVPGARAAPGPEELRPFPGHLVHGVHHRRDGGWAASLRRRLGDRHHVPHLQTAGNAERGGLAGLKQAALLPELLPGVERHRVGRPPRGRPYARRRRHRSASSQLRIRPQAAPLGPTNHGTPILLRHLLRAGLRWPRAHGRLARDSGRIPFCGTVNGPSEIGRWLPEAQGRI
mmetsp:Transcript_32667/g.97033  ORF Transcript_32667/g.97033 Transcript_32667/m.97033 type:complete len:229 (-) Transcript_32667:2-688(-)